MDVSLCEKGTVTRHIMTVVIIAMCIAASSTEISSSTLGN